MRWWPKFLRSSVEPVATRAHGATMSKRNRRTGAVAFGFLAFAAMNVAVGHNRPVRARSGGSRETRLAVRVFDAQTHAPLPALVRLRAADGKTLTFGNFADLPGWGQGASAVELGGGREGVLAFWHGFALWRGEGTIVVGRPWPHRNLHGQGQVASVVPPARYTVEVTRGPEYDQEVREVDLSAERGLVRLDVELERTVDTRGYVSADLHVHHAPHSPDAQLDAASQLKIAAVNGVEAIVAANHGHVVDLDETASDLWPTGPDGVVPLAGLEHEAAEAHFGVFPLPPGQPLPPLRPWPLEQLFSDLHALPGDPVVIGYHPRLGWKAYLDAPYCGAWAAKDFSAPPPCPQDFDALEIVTSWQGCGSRQRDATESWLALLSHSFVSAPLGSSDSHFASAMLPGYPRTWLRVGDDRPARITAQRLVRAVRARHTVASTSPFITLRSGGASEGDFVPRARGNVNVRVRVQAANWVPIDTVRLLVNGTIVKSWSLDAKEHAVDFRTEASVKLDGKDVFITAETDSRRPLPADVVGEYASRAEFGLSRCPPRAEEEGGMPAYAVTAPLLLDGDGDGRFTGFRAHAPVTKRL